MKRLILGVLIFVLIIVSTGCYGQKSFEKEFGGNQFDLVKLSEIQYYGGKMGGSILGFSGDFEGGSGLVIAIETKSENVVLIQNEIGKFTIKYENVVPYVKVTYRRGFMENPRRHYSDSEVFKYFANQFEIHLPKDSAGDFISQW